MKYTPWFLFVAFVSLWIFVFYRYTPSARTWAEFEERKAQIEAESETARKVEAEETDRLRMAFPRGRIVRIGDGDQQAVVLSHDRFTVKVLAASGPVDVHHSILHLLPAAPLSPAESPVGSPGEPHVPSSQQPKMPTE